MHIKVAERRNCDQAVEGKPAVVDGILGSRMDRKHDGPLIRMFLEVGQHFGKSTRVVGILRTMDRRHSVGAVFEIEPLQYPRVR